MSDTRRRRSLRAWWARQDDYERRTIRRQAFLVVLIGAAVSIALWAGFMESALDDREIRDCEDRLGGTPVQVQDAVICFAPGVVLTP